MNDNEIERKSEEDEVDSDVCCCVEDPCGCYVDPCGCCVEVCCC